MKKITVLGAGNGGQTMAGYLAAQGNQVTLFEHPDFKDKLLKIRNKGEITLKGALNCSGKLAMATSDPREAVNGADIIYLVAPTFAQKPMFELVAQFLKDDQIIILLPGNFGSLSLQKLLKEKGINARLGIAEADTIPFACRQIEPGLIDVWGMKKTMSLASLPGNDIDRIISEIQDYFPLPLEPAPNIIAIGLYNTNMILHCPTMIMNAGRIDSDVSGFQFYKDGMSASVCKVMEAMDRERMNIGSALGIDLLSTMEDMKKIYQLDGETLRETILNNPVYCGHGKDSPSSINHRYLNEDVPYLLVPVSELGKILGVPTPVMDSTILLSGIINSNDYFRTGINLEKLGLDGLSKEEIIKLVNQGN